MAKIETAYPLPKNMLPKDIEKRLFKYSKNRLGRRGKSDSQQIGGLAVCHLDVYSSFDSAMRNGK
jgi:hypothetical protein